MKNFNFKSLIVGLLTIGTLSYASATCIPLTKEQLIKNNISILFHPFNKKTDIDLLKYCYNEEAYNKSIAMINDIDTLTKLDKDLHLSTRKISINGISFLSYMINYNPQKEKELKKEEFQELVKMALNYYPDSKFTEQEIVQFFTKENREHQKYLMIKYLLSQNNNNINSFNVKDSYGNTPLTYAVVNNNVGLVGFLINDIKKNSYVTQSLDTRNLNGLNIYHIAFSNMLKGQKTEAMNNVLIESLKTEKIKNLDISNVSFVEFAYLSRENNIDLYQKVKKLYNFTDEQVASTINDYKKKTVNDFYNKNGGLNFIEIINTISSLG